MLFFIYFISGEIDKLNFGQPQHLHWFVQYWSLDAPPSDLQKFKFLASSIVQVYTSSSTRCDAVSVSSQLNTYIVEV